MSYLKQSSRHTLCKNIFHAPLYAPFGLWMCEDIELFLADSVENRFCYVRGWYSCLYQLLPGLAHSHRLRTPLLLLWSILEGLRIIPLCIPQTCVHKFRAED